MLLQFRLSIAISTILSVTTAKAQFYELPPTCNAVLYSARDCGIDSSAQIDYAAFDTCFCQDPALPTIAQNCLNSVDSSQLLGQDAVTSLQKLQSFCAEIANAGAGANGGSSPSVTPGPAPTEGVLSPDAGLCSSLVASLSSCGATETPDLTAAGVASCVCGADNISNIVQGCFSFLSTANPTGLVDLATLTKGYCNDVATAGSEPTSRASSSGAAPPNSTLSPVNSGTTQGSSGPSQTRAGGASSGASSTSSGPASSTSTGAASSIGLTMSSTFLGVLSLWTLFL
ncbi:hypothetical protein ABW20_dc0108755 [Dactylellina cionopaga]|nr:hypothetical protein ABW20_dc0108755 [Dactylellina cionopaga]